ncbi:histidine kinase dimerization/phosphoacceptor domain -containing protein [Sphingomonas prati]|uniref:histidine kinase n=1 Tax=Sphingomonas prati TaxID=1843237 RepID=A0A7W9BVN0_9SPHN|nr:histidine kinase dimerization/phosphoacceptor domain -containing protein [Sphingomonas prati]MBB5730855.1 two-component sensor histidine kinase [Sphingomonas prati]
MANRPGSVSFTERQAVQTDDLLLRETIHRCSNDLQLVVSLLSLQSRRAASEETRQALTDAMERVAVLARCRSTLYQDRQLSLEAALRQVCEALHAQAEPRSILVSLTVAQEVDGLSSTQITTLALVVNELATNGIKHAYEEGKSGYIEITLGRNASQDVTIFSMTMGFLSPIQNTPLPMVSAWDLPGG